MTTAELPRGRIGIYLGLGRVSNLPTVWTDVLAGAVLAGGERDAATLSALSASLSAFYVGGMFLNDAFDREIDRRERPERPIPSGRITAVEVFLVVGALLAAGLAGAALVATPGARSGAAISGLILGALVVLYDAWHKGNALAPFFMGLCRAAVYVTAGLAAGGTLTAPLVGGCAPWIMWPCEGNPQVYRPHPSSRIDRRAGPPGHQPALVLASPDQGPVP